MIGKTRGEQTMGKRTNIAILAMGILLMMPYPAAAADLWTEQPGFQLGPPANGTPTGNSQGNSGNAGNAGQNSAPVQQLETQVQSLQNQLKQIRQQYQQLQQQYQQLQQQNQQVQQQLQQLQQDNQRLKQENEQLKQEIEQLRQNGQHLQDESNRQSQQNRQNSGQASGGSPQIRFHPPAGYEEIELYRPAFLKDGKVMVPIAYLLMKFSPYQEGDRNQVRFYKDSTRMDYFSLRYGHKTASFASNILTKPATSIELEETVSTYEGCMNYNTYTCWYLPLDSRITEYFGYRAVWHAEDRVVTLGDKYYFKVYDEHWTRDELQYRRQYTGTWDLYLLSGTELRESWGTMEIREDGTMMWDDKVAVNRGRWQLSPEKRGEAVTTNGFNGYSWNLAFQKDGTLKVYGHAMTIIGYKRFDEIPTTFSPPAGMKEIRLQTPAFVDNGQIYISSAVVRPLKGSMEWSFNAIKLGTAWFYFSVADGTYYTSYDQTRRALSGKPQIIDGVLYLPAKEVVEFLGYDMTYNRTHQVLLLDNEFFLKIVDKPVEPVFP
jgi:uncharacterized protein YoxC